MNRRKFIKNIALTSFISGIAFLDKKSLFALNKSYAISEQSVKIFFRIINKAKKLNWKNYSSGDLNILIAQEFLDIKYLGATLEGEGAERCRADFTGLDCVTLVENTLALSRIIKKEKHSVADFFDELTFVRYRSGILGDYATRLHYSSDWISDNVQKGVFKDISKDMGGVERKFELNFMTNNPQYYKALERDSTLIPKIAEIEEKINEKTFHIIEKKSIQAIEHLINNGDIICFTTNKAGLDFAHLGFAFVQRNKPPKLLHASSKQKKVLIDTSISDYANSVSNISGIAIARVVSL